MGDQRLRKRGVSGLPKRDVSGKLENAEKTWAGGEGERMNGLRGRGSSEVWYHGGLEYHRIRPWGLVQPSMRRGV